MTKLQRAIGITAIATATILLQGCLTSVVTAPVKVVYGAGKLAVKGTAAAVRAVVPDGDKKDEDKKQDQPSSDQKAQQQQTTP